MHRGRPRKNSPTPSRHRRGIILHMLVMSLDVGTSSARARCFDASGAGVPGTDTQVKYEPITTPDGAAELDADLLVHAVARAIDASLEGCGRRAEAIAAVG